VKKCPSWAYYTHARDLEDETAPTGDASASSKGDASAGWSVAQGVADKRALAHLPSPEEFLAADCCLDGCHKGLSKETVEHSRRHFVAADGREAENRVVQQLLFDAVCGSVHYL